MFKGPLGIWPCPFLNLLFGDDEEESKFSIKDHEVVAGYPTPPYSGKFTIQDTSTTPLWRLKLAYDIRLKMDAHRGDDKMSLEGDFKMGGDLWGGSQEGSGGWITTYEQISPR